jgi:hypothetical protein
VWERGKEVGMKRKGRRQRGEEVGLDSEKMRIVGGKRSFWTRKADGGKEDRSKRSKHGVTAFLHLILDQGVGKCSVGT